MLVSWLRFLPRYFSSDLEVAKDQEGAWHCLLPSPTAVLHTWEAAADVRAGVPSPCHAIHGVAVVNGATGYQIWRRGRTALPPSHTHSSGYKLDRGGTPAPPQPAHTLKIRRLVLIW